MHLIHEDGDFEGNQSINNRLIENLFLQTAV